MKKLFLLGLALAALACSASADEKGKGTKVTIDGLSSVAPADWVKKDLPGGSMRFAQFRLPKAEGAEEAEIVIFKLGGSAAQNVARWKAQFQPASSDKESKLKIGGHDAVMLDITGTYNPPPFDPTFKGKKAGFRLVGIQLEGPENTYQIKLLGPAKTVEKHKKAFDAWIKDFKK